MFLISVDILFLGLKRLNESIEATPSFGSLLFQAG
jgi:hypothetical protein